MLWQYYWNDTKPFPSIAEVISHPRNAWPNRIKLSLLGLVILRILHYISIGFFLRTPTWTAWFFVACIGLVFFDVSCLLQEKMSLLPPFQWWRRIINTSVFSTKRSSAQLFAVFPVRVSASPLTFPYVNLHFLKLAWKSLYELRVIGSISKELILLRSNFNRNIMNVDFRCH